MIDMPPWPPVLSYGSTVYTTSGSTASCTFTVFCTFIKKRWNNAFFVPSVQGQVRDGISSDNNSMQVDGLIGGGTFGAPSADLARANLPVGARQVQTWRANL